MNRTCQFPEGDPRDPANFRFCGAPVARPGLPYCGEHMRRAYLRDPARRPVLRKSPLAGQGCESRQLKGAVHFTNAKRSITQRGGASGSAGAACVVNGGAGTKGQ
jgi:GcrA cell cycle regulator